MDYFGKFVSEASRLMLCLVVLPLVSGCTAEESTDAPRPLPAPPPAPAVEAETQPPNVVVILIDTVRADRTSLAGHDRDTTPGLVSIAKEGMTFSQHFANAPWTRPSVASIMTGLLPPTHRSQWGDIRTAVSGEIDLLPEAFDTLPEILQRHGYSTHAFMTNGTIAAEFGYGQGFDFFEMLGSQLEHDRKAVQLTKKALRSSAGPVFVWCHLMAPHNYKLPPEAERFTHEWRTLIKRDQPHGKMMLDGYQITAREQAQALYDGTLVFADSLVTDLIDFIRRSKPNTLVIVTSDHGEEFAEHGGYGHSRTLYNEVIRVPLVLWGPGIPAGLKLDRLTSSVDLLPTVLDYLDLPAAPVQGTSLLTESPDPNRVVYAEKRSVPQAMRALITTEGKLIEIKPPIEEGPKPPMAGEGRFEFYADPLGGDDKAEPLSEEKFKALRAQLDSIWNESSRRFEEATGRDEVRGGLTKDDVEMLRMLGYGH